MSRVLSRVFVTGVGVVSSVGSGRAAFFDAVKKGVCGICPIESFDTNALERNMGGEVKDFKVSDHLSAAESKRMGRCSAFAVAASRMAVTDSGMGSELLTGARTAVILGTTMGEADVISQLDHAWITRGDRAVARSLLPKYGSTLLPIHVARAVGARGMVMTLPGACAAGNYAIGLGADWIRSGRADVVIAGSVEIIQQLEFSGFVRLAAMAPSRCQPFDKNRQGLILGEGAGIVILESEAHAVKRHARVQVEVGGYGLSCDAYHITRPRPDAVGSTAAMIDAIKRSGITANDIDFVNAHGTGTHANDLAEAKVMRDVFGARPVPISSMKSTLGHCMGAAASIEAIGCVMTIETGIYPPTIGYETPDPECDVEVVANVARSGPSEIVLNNSLAFGGYNAVTCFAKPGVLPPPTEKPAA